MFAGRTFGAGVAVLVGALLWAALAFAAINFPPLTGRVNDGANVLTPQTRAALETKLADLENKSSIQLVVATVPSLQDNDIETFANGLFRAWKLGEAKRNNGVLLLVAPNERKVRIEVGYGMEGVITDALSSVIIQSAIIPKFKTGDFSAGVDRGVDALVSAMTDDQSEWHKKVKVRTDSDQDSLEALMPFLLFALFVFIIYMQSRNARRGIGRRGGPIIIPSGSWGGGSWGGGGGSSWGGGGGFDGGGFSGGGGSSGGGGASGSW